MSSAVALECSICTQGYNEEDRCPRLLKCGHTFCSCCLQKLMSGSRINCPQDRSIIVLANGVKDLPKNFSLLEVIKAQKEKEINFASNCEVCDEDEHFAESYCLDCAQAMCGEMANAHSKLRSSKHHSIVPVSKVDSTTASMAAFCAEHDQAYRYFDIECNVLICADCSALKHCSHKCQSLLEAATNCSKEAQEMFKNAQYKIGQLKSSMNRIAGMRQGLTEQFQEANSELEQQFQEIIRSANARRETLSAKLKKGFHSKSRVLDEQFKQLESIHAGLLSGIEQTKQAIEVGSNVPTLLAYSNLRKTLKMTDLNEACVHPNVDDVLLFCGDCGSLSTTIQKFGNIIESGIQCEAAGFGLSYALPGRNGTFLVKVIDKDHPVFSGDRVPFTVHIQEKVAGNLSTSISKTGEGVYQVSYPGVRDVTEMMVSILVSGAYIKGSPFIIRNFFEDFKNLAVVDKCWYKSETNGHDSWAESMSLSNGERIDIDVSCEINNCDFNRNSVMEILFLEHKAILDQVAPSANAPLKYNQHVQARSRGFLNTAKTNTKVARIPFAMTANTYDPHQSYWNPSASQQTTSTMRLFVDFKQKICGSDDFGVWAWKDSVKVRFVLQSTAKFSVNVTG